MDLELIEKQLLRYKYRIWNYVLFLDQAVSNWTSADDKVHQVLVSSDAFIFSLTFNVEGKCTYRLFFKDLDLELVAFQMIGSYRGNSTIKIKSRLCEFETSTTHECTLNFRNNHDTLIKSMHLIV